jgi:glutamine amidotransferase
MQLMAERGLEFEIVDGFGWIAGEVVAIEPNDPMLKIPHMGWNELYPRSGHPVLAGLPAGTHVYFVHGFELYPSDPANVLAETDYGGPIVAAVGRDNLIGTQFHPDKSQGAGLRLIGNFLRWRP